MTIEETTKMLIEIREGMAAMKGDIDSLRVELKSTWNRIDEQKTATDTVHELVLCVRDLTNSEHNTSEALLRLRQRTEKEIDALRVIVDEIRLKPAKRWDSAVTQIVQLIIAGAVGALLAWLSQGI